jgi:hypothetical protein
MSEEEAATIFGPTVVLRLSTGMPNIAPEVSVELHAGFGCTWSPADGTHSFGLSVVLLPAGVVAYDEPSGCAAEDPERIAPFCAVEATANGTRISGTIYNESATLDEVEGTRDSLLALFDQRAKAAEPAPVPIPAVGAWAHPVDCAAVVAAGDFSAVPGLGAASTGVDFPFGSHDYAIAAVDAIENGSAEFPWCWIEGENAQVLFVASGGGRWLEDVVGATAEPFVIEGYDSAYVSPGADGLTKVDIFDGPNWLHFQIMHVANAKPLADALFAALSTTAAS